LIEKLNNIKARRKLDVETRFIKLANPVISVYLSHLSWLTEGSWSSTNL